MNFSFLIITLNPNRLNTTIKGQRLEEWIKKHDPIMCCLQETCFGFTDTIKFRVKGWKRCIVKTATKRELEWRS